MQIHYQQEVYHIFCRRVHEKTWSLLADQSNWNSLGTNVA